MEIIANMDVQKVTMVTKRHGSVRVAQVTVGYAVTPRTVQRVMKVSTQSPDPVCETADRITSVWAFYPRPM